MLRASLLRETLLAGGGTSRSASAFRYTCRDSRCREALTEQQFAAVVWVGLCSCGGSGTTGSGASVPNVPEVQRPPSAPAPPESPAEFPDAPSTSYELQNSLLRPHLGPIRYTAGVSPEHDPTQAGAVAYGDFDGDGLEDFFVGVLDNTANPRPAEMWLNTGDGYELRQDIFRGVIPRQVNPRKALSGDFNGDGRLDIFVAGHGFDEPPFPGESPVLILSTEDGGLRDTGDLRGHIGFLHGAASADIDRDGDLDVFVTDTRQPFVLRNEGDGRLIYDLSPVPVDLTEQNVYTVELIDLNEDGFPDLLIGGHEHEGAATAIYWGNRAGVYQVSDKSVLPAVSGFGIVVDLDAEDLDNDGVPEIFVTRTGDDPFYAGFFLQILASDDGVTYRDESEHRITGGSHPEAPWVLWLRIQDLNDDGHRDLWDDRSWRPRRTWLNDGTGRFSAGPDLPDTDCRPLPRPRIGCKE